MLGTAVGIILEIIGGIVVFDHHPFYYLTHQVLYSSFFLVGAIAWLESRGKLPLDSSRASAALIFGLASLLWCEHASMKENPVDRKIHTYLGIANGGTSAGKILSSHLRGQGFSC